MKKHVVNCMTGESRTVDLTGPEIAARNAESAQAAIRLADKRAAQALAEKRLAAVEALLEEQLTARAAGQDVPEAIAEYIRDATT